MYILAGPHRGSKSEYAVVCRSFDSIDDALSYICSCYEGSPFCVSDLGLRYVTRNHYNVVTDRFFDQDFLSIYGSPQCVGHIVFMYS